MKLILFLIVTTLVFGISLKEGFSEKLENTYTNEKCGISINYPKDWKAENVDYKIEGLRPILVK
jgi:hypothetical protein